eukprot:2038426-Alexandrium_andersonii.AAC.1
MDSSWGDVLHEALRERGGWKQRVAGSAQALPRPEPEHSLLAERLLLLTGRGLISSATAQWLAEGATTDGLVQGDIVKLSGLGHRGMYPGNCRRDLLRTFCKNMSVPRPLSFSVPLLAKNRK